MSERTSVEKAQAVLDMHPDSYPEWLEFFHAIVEERLPEYFLDRFRSKRDDYSDELPETDVRLLIDRNIAEEIQAGREPGSTIRYKCQMNYLVGVSLTMQQAIKEEVITDPALIEEFQHTFTSELRFQVGDPDNMHKLAQVNTILDHAIAHIETQVDSSALCEE